MIWESNAILFYLGRKFAPNPIFTDEPETFGRIAQWLLFGKTTDHSLAPARYRSRFVSEGERDESRLSELREAGRCALAVVDGRLSTNRFLAGEYSIADIGCYPHISLAQEEGVDISEFKM